MIKIVLSGTPIPFKAPYVSSRRSFNPRYKEKEATQWFIRNQIPTEFLITNEAVEVHYDFFFPIPVATSKKKQAKMLAGEIHHLKRPDVSNLCKFYEDCLKGIVFLDDSQVISIFAKKGYTEHPRTVISVKNVTERFYGERNAL